MKRFAIIFGALMLAAGIAGFVPALSPNGLLFGIFAVDALHNVVHIATGLAAIGCAMASDIAARNFFRIFGVVYGLIAVLGLIAGGDGKVMGMAMNMADHLLHVAVAAVSLWAGFAWHPALPPSRGPDAGLRGA